MMYLEIKQVQKQIERDYRGRSRDSKPRNYWEISADGRREGGTRDVIYERHLVPGLLAFLLWRLT